MMAAAELAALRLRDLPSAKGIEIDQREREYFVFLTRMVMARSALMNLWK